jgi:hypothetical protein
MSVGDVEALAEVIDQAEKGLLPGTAVTDAWQDRVAYGVLESDWLEAYVAAERARAWDEGYEAGDDDTAYAFRGRGPHEDHVNPYRAS